MKTNTKKIILTNTILTTLFLISYYIWNIYYIKYKLKININTHHINFLIISSIITVIIIIIITYIKIIINKKTAKKQSSFLMYKIRNYYCSSIYL